jgi:hypothetical protein
LGPLPIAGKLPHAVTPANPEHMMAAAHARSAQRLVTVTPGQLLDHSGEIVRGKQ